MNKKSVLLLVSALLLLSNLWFTIVGAQQSMVTLTVGV